MSRVAIDIRVFVQLLDLRLISFFTRSRFTFGAGALSHDELNSFRVDETIVGCLSVRVIDMHSLLLDRLFAGPGMPRRGPSVLERQCDLSGVLYETSGTRPCVIAGPVDARRNAVAHDPKPAPSEVLLIQGCP